MPSPVTLSSGRTFLSDEACRLCEGHLVARFSGVVLHKYEVRYFECDRCGSLQTEVPYWLDDAYTFNLSSLDAGSVQRNLQNLAAAYVVSKLFGVRDALDFGGGDGLLCRLLRDYGVNCYVKDKYAVPTYSQGFSEPDFAAPNLVLAFEVLEHFAAPALELEDLFQSRPTVLLASTGIYRCQRSDWWYLACESGQHVFFYSEKAVQMIAERFGYSSVLSGGYLLFARATDHKALKFFLARILLNRMVCRLLRGLILIMPAPGAWRDHLSAKSK
ncbi:MAG TPA: class I SAM-dependent methyltransferase [Steroidobacteraceae bacterium]|nr:class I SAM-dependent methyltransferase [Steroidobacteraceae bacterium]